MYGKMQDFIAPVFVLLLISFPQVSVPYEAKESSSGQNGCADFEYDISILIKRRFQWHTMKIRLIKRYDTI